METSENKNKEWYKERCKDCPFLLEGYSGDWICDAFSKYCEDIEDCVDAGELRGY